MAMIAIAIHGVVAALLSHLSAAVYYHDEALYHCSSCRERLLDEAIRRSE